MSESSIPNNSDAALDRFTHFLQGRDLRMTNQRKLILDVFWQLDHVTPEELLHAVKSRGASVGQATIYRTLRLFVESGIADELLINDGSARYEKSDSPHHDHLICVMCGGIIEFVNDEIEALQESIAKSFNMVITDHHLTLYARPVSPEDCKLGRCTKVLQTG